MDDAGDGDAHDEAANDGGVVSLQGKAFGRHFKKLRSKRGLSREELGGRSGLSITTVRRIEKGHQATLDTSRKAAMGFDLPLSALFMSFEDEDAGIREISFSLRGRDPKWIALVGQVVRTLVDEAEAT